MTGVSVVPAQVVVLDEDTLYNNKNAVFFAKDIVQDIDTTNIETIEVNGVSFKMCFVKGGKFKMGARPSGDGESLEDEYPVHQVVLDDYRIGQTEVTQELWAAVTGEYPSLRKGDKYPVEQVTWEDCQEFIAKLNELTGRMFSLPTEAQWEYAARGGNKARGCKYSGSDALEEVAWYTYNANDVGINSPDYGIHEVATKLPNELGIYDMSGNVWEWCSDWYGEYANEMQKNPKGPSTGTLRIDRGASWYNRATRCRVTNRGAFKPDETNEFTGLRLACGIK